MSSIIEPALLTWGFTLASYSITLVCCLVMHPDKLVSPTFTGGEVKNVKGEKEGMERPTNKGGVADTIEEKLGKKG